MKILTLLMFLMLSCGQTKSSTSMSEQEKKEDGNYLVVEITSKNNWNIIYAQKDDRLYKIVTQKKVNEEKDNCVKIQVKNSYNFKIHSSRENAPKVNGVKLNATNVDCFNYDEETYICIEPEKQIYDLHYADNIDGLCLTEN